MTLSHAYRLLLVSLLPVIVVVLYLEGQQYDPGLIRFESLQAQEGGPASLLPRETGNYELAGRVRTYSSENLYEYVNGHAEYFISAGFRDLAVGDYAEKGQADGGPDVTVDIYDMGKSIQAFGILSDESRGNISGVGGGLTGFRTPLGASFVKGRYYIRIAAYNEDIPVDKFINTVAGALDTGSDPFPEFSRLPDIGETVATRFIREAYRGLDFVNNVIEREYRVDGEFVQVFAVSSGGEEIRELEGEFVDYFHGSDIKYRIAEIKDRKVYRVDDPYEGEWVMIAGPDSLYGVYGAFDETMVDKLITNQ